MRFFWEMKHEALSGIEGKSSCVWPNLVRTTSEALERNKTQTEKHPKHPNIYRRRLMWKKHLLYAIHLRTAWRDAGSLQIAQKEQIWSQPGETQWNCCIASIYEMASDILRQLVPNIFSNLDNPHYELIFAMYGFMRTKIGTHNKDK